jgi:hypothetical protein
MDIKLFVTKNGIPSLVCYEQAFKELIESVELDYMTSFLSVNLATSNKSVELNCPVHYEVIHSIIDQDRCAIGFMIKGKLKGAILVPFNVVNLPENNWRQMQ